MAEQLDTRTYSDLVRESPSICANCTNVHKYSMINADQGYRCKAHRIKFVSNAGDNFAECAVINSDGNCPDFKVLVTPKLEVVTDLSRRTLWQKFKYWLML